MISDLKLRTLKQNCYPNWFTLQKLFYNLNISIFRMSHKPPTPLNLSCCVFSVTSPVRPNSPASSAAAAGSETWPLRSRSCGRPGRPSSRSPPHSLCHSFRSIIYRIFFEKLIHKGVGSLKFGYFSSPNEFDLIYIWIIWNISSSKNFKNVVLFTIIIEVKEH